MRLRKNSPNGSSDFDQGDALRETKLTAGVTEESRAQFSIALRSSGNNVLAYIFDFN